MRYSEEIKVHLQVLTNSTPGPTRGADPSYIGPKCREESPSLWEERTSRYHLAGTIKTQAATSDIKAVTTLRKVVSKSHPHLFQSQVGQIRVQVASAVKCALPACAKSTQRTNHDSAPSHRLAFRHDTETLTVPRWQARTQAMANVRVSTLLFHPPRGATQTYERWNAEMIEEEPR